MTTDWEGTTCPITGGAHAFDHDGICRACLPLTEDEWTAKYVVVAHIHESTAEPKEPKE